MPIRFYNTLTRKKEVFQPIKEGEVGMYTCGPTVYDYAHIGNFRTFIFEDLLKRYLLHRGYKVYHIMNITDIDDKTIKRSREENTPLGQMTDKFTGHFMDDSNWLKIIPANEYPRATDSIPKMIEMIQLLLKKEYAYTDNDGSIYFNIQSYPDYGQLTNLDLNAQRTTNRIASDEYTKDDPQDFALWKGWKEEDGDVAWDAPWGKGRPGWHIECSAMSNQYLGDHFDIHCGGVDNIFPHHENEIAQSCCANKTENFANYWLHNGFVTFDKEKMSKSIGNIVSINKLRENVNGQVVRLALLSSHYKQPLDWNEKLITESKNTLDRWYNQWEQTPSEEIEDEVLEPLLEDLNTPEYITKLHFLYDEAKKGSKISKVKFTTACNLIGLLESTPLTWKDFKKNQSAINESFINNKIKDRNIARKKRDFNKADVIRKELEDNGVIIEDKQDKTIWKYK